MKAKIGFLATAVVAAIALTSPMAASASTVQSASRAVNMAASATGSFQCIPQTQDFTDSYGNHVRYEYLGGVYSAGHAFYKYHKWTYPFDNGIVTCKAS